MSKVEPKFLWICVDDQGLKEFEPIFSGKEIEKFNSEVFFERYEELTDGVYAMIIVGGSDGMDLAYEAAQITQLQCPQTPTIFATTEKHDFHPKKLKKKGI